MKKCAMFLVLSTFLLGAMTSCEKDEPKKEETFNTYAASGVENGHEYVDLGLSVKWAINSIEEPYTKETGWYVRAEKRDELAASWGGNWRLPTEGELWELALFCKWDLIWKDGRPGARITSKTNGKSIFVPMGYTGEMLSDPDLDRVCIWSSEEIKIHTPALDLGTALYYVPYWGSEQFGIPNAMCAAIRMVLD
jgi:hypothetical protein